MWAGADAPCRVGAQAAKAKARALYVEAAVVALDEGAQTPFEHLDTYAVVVRGMRTGGGLLGGQRLV